MSIFEWACDRADELKSARQLRARNRQLRAANVAFAAALNDFLGDRPDIQSGHCIRCGRDYGDEPGLEGANCPSNDCPGYAARQLCARAKAGAL